MLIWLDIQVDLDAAIKAVEAVDKCLGEVVNYIIRIGGNRFNNCRSWQQ